MRPALLAIPLIQVCFAAAAASTPPVSTKPAQLPPKQLEGIVVHEPQSPACGGVKFVGAAVLKQLVPQPAPGAPAEVVIVRLESSRPDVARVPEVVRIKPGEQAGRFEVNTERLAAEHADFRIVARLGNERAESNPVRIRGPRVTNIEGHPGTDCEGGKETFTARFDCPAPSSGVRLHLSGSGIAYGSESVAVTGGNSASEKVMFSRCCGANPCHWSVKASLRAGEDSWGVRTRSGNCGQPDSCPN